LMTCTFVGGGLEPRIDGDVGRVTSEALPGWLAAGAF
jgi:hypothetical protein